MNLGAPQQMSIWGRNYCNYCNRVWSLLRQVCAQSSHFVATASTGVYFGRTETLMFSSAQDRVTLCYLNTPGIYLNFQCNGPGHVWVHQGVPRYLLIALASTDINVHDFVIVFVSFVTNMMTEQPTVEAASEGDISTKDGGTCRLTFNSPGGIRVDCQGYILSSQCAENYKIQQSQNLGSSEDKTDMDRWGL